MCYNTCEVNKTTSKRRRMYYEKDINRYHLGVALYDDAGARADTGHRLGGGE